MVKKMQISTGLKLYRIIQLFWSFQILIISLLVIAQASSLFWQISFLIIGLGSIILSLSLFKYKKAPWVISAIGLIGYWILHGWQSLANFIYNNYAFFTNNSLYQDSPATIFIVYINALFGIFPAGLLLILLLYKREEITNIIKNKD